MNDTTTNSGILEARREEILPASDGDAGVSEFLPVSDPTARVIEAAPLRTRIVNLIAILLPFAGIIAAGVLVWPFGLGWVPLGLLLVMYLLTGLGVTVGYHRLFTHRSFETSRFMTFIIGVLGSMAVEGPLLSWVATHRCHHQHSDGEEDPHSPHTHGGGFFNTLRGLWHAHMGWLLTKHSPDLQRYVPDLSRDRMIRVISKLFPLWLALGLLFPAVVGGLLTMSWLGVLLGFIWGGLVRVFLVHHVTWSINSVCHLWGAQPFDCKDHSRNNPICGVLGFGEGWHNNHHAFPTSARHGLRWWQLDTSYLVIRAMGMVGMAWNIRVPPDDRIAVKRQRG